MEMYILMDPRGHYVYNSLNSSKLLCERHIGPKDGESEDEAWNRLEADGWTVVKVRVDIWEI